jgi:hypothetical protein
MVDIGGSARSFVAYGSDLDSARHRGQVLGGAVAEILRVSGEVAPRIARLLADRGDDSANPLPSPAPIAFEVGRCETVELASAEQPVSARWTARFADAHVAAEGDAVGRSAAEALEIARRRACFSAQARYASRVLSGTATAPPETRAQFVASGMKEAEEWLLSCLRDGEASFEPAPSNTVTPPDTYDLVRCEATLDALPDVSGPTVGVGLGWSVSGALEDARVAAIVDAYRAVDVAFGEVVGQVDPASRSHTFATSLERSLRTGALAPFVEGRGFRCERWEIEGQETTFTPAPECSFANAGPHTRELSDEDAFSPCDAVRDAGRAATNEAVDAATPAERPKLRAVGEGETAACERSCRQTLSFVHGRHEPVPHDETGAADCSTEERARASLRAGRRDRDAALALACLDETVVSELLREVEPPTTERLFDWLARLDDVPLEAHRGSHGGVQLGLAR